MQKTEIMKPLRTYSVSASSLTESVIAMVIVAACLSIAMMIYGQVLRSDRNIALYKGAQKVKELIAETILNKSFEDEIYDYETYSIEKKVEAITEKVYKVELHVKSQQKTEHYQYILE